VDDNFSQNKTKKMKIEDVDITFSTFGFRKLLSEDVSDFFGDIKFSIEFLGLSVKLQKPIFIKVR
jgi:hypothetical protein